MESGNGVVEEIGFGEGVDGEGEDGLGLGAGEDGGGAGAGVGGDEVEEGAELGEAVGGGEGAGHPVEGEVGVAERVEGGGGPCEEVEVEVGEGRVVMELGFQKVEEGVRGERWGPVGFQEVQEAGVVDGGDGCVSWCWWGGERTTRGFHFHQRQLLHRHFQLLTLTTWFCTLVTPL